MIEIRKKVQQIAKRAEGRKSEIEALRNIPSDLMQEVKKAGLVRMWATKEVGGAQCSVQEATEIIRQMAYHNGSLAWVVGVTNCASLLSGYIDEHLNRLLFASEQSMVGGFAGPAGKAERAGGGLKVSGRWSWGSGITHCSHIVGGVRITENEKPTGTAAVFFTPDEITFIDNWYVLGLKGTHSIDYEVNDLFIPDDRWIHFPIQKAQVDDPLYRFSFLGALSLSVAAVGLGLADRAVDEIIALSQTKRPFGQGKPLAQRPNFQEALGRLMGLVKSASALYKSTIITATAEARDSLPSKETKADIRLAACHAANISQQVVTEAYRLGGGTSIWQNHKLEELFRDMNVVTQHGMVSSSNYRTVGAVFSGNEVPDILL